MGDETSAREAADDEAIRAYLDEESARTERLDTP